MLFGARRTGLACLLLAAVSSLCRAESTPSQLVYFGTWPHRIVVFDTEQEKVVDTIDLKSDVPRTLILSPDKKTLYAATLNDNSIVSIDLAARKIVSQFGLNHGNQKIRVMGLAMDRSGKWFYGLAVAITEQIDHYDISPAEFIVIDIAAQRIVRTAECPKDDSPFGFRTALKLSPDGKLLYVFRENIQIFDTTSFQLVKKIDLGKPLAPGIENVSLNLLDDPNEEIGKVVSVFHSSDPYVHRAIFGIGIIDLANLSFEFSPVAPSTAGSMLPLLLTPDRKIGYTVAVDGDPGNRRCEFWAFDMQTRKLIRRHEFDGRTRFFFGLSADGKKILIYGAGYQVEVYDAASFELRSDVEVPGDITTNVVVLPLTSATGKKLDRSTGQ